VKKRFIDILFLAALALCANKLRAAQAATAPAGGEQILIGAGKTRLLDMPVNIERVSVASPEIAEAVPVSARSLMINGRAPGETSLVIWLNDGSRREYDVDVQIAPSRLIAAREQLNTEFGGNASMTVDNGAVYLTGRVSDLYASERAVSIAATMGRVVNLLKVDIPPQAQQILLKVRFANVDRSKASDLGINFFGAPQGFPFTATVGTYSPTTITGLTSSTLGGSASGGSSSSASLSLSDALNLLFFDPHLNLGATLKALQAQSVLEILAEPNVLAINGKEASFVAGGEFPFPTLQGGGGGVGQVTIQFREYGVRIHFLPIITPRGTIRLHVTPEVSSLDYANSLSVSGFTVPALATRRIDTEVELESGQSFAIAGLLDNRTTESLSKIPGLANIPLFGKLFQTKSVSKTNSELMVIVTPELVAPIAEGQALPDLPRPTSFLEGAGIVTQAPRTPGTDVTGPAPPRPRRAEVPVQEMQQIQRDLLSAGTAPQVAATPQNPTQPINGGGTSGTSDAPAANGAGASSTTPDAGSTLRIGR
jgi:pilus assembly protein CpaC